MDFLNDLPLINQLSLETRLNITRVLLVIFVLLVLWLLRHVLAALISRPLRALVSNSSNPYDNVILDTLDDVIGYIILGIVLLAAVPLLNIRPPESAFITRLAFTLIAYGLLRSLYSAGSRILLSQKRARRFLSLEIQGAMMPLIRIGYRVFVIAIGLLVIAQIWNVNVAGLVAGIGLGGLALSLAAKEVLDDVLGFMVIVGDDIYRHSEYIVSPNAEGIIERIGLRSTRVRQLDQGLVIVPNSTLANDPVTNWSRLEKRWFNFLLGIMYSTRAEEIEGFISRLREMLQQREHVDPDSVVVLFLEFDDSALNILIRCYVDLPDWVEAHMERSAINLEITRLANEMHIGLAFPSRSLYLEQIPNNVLNTLRSNGSHTPKEEANQPEQARRTNAAEGQGRRYFRQGGKDAQPDTDYEGDGDE
ncbi:MAG: mechanosensitive ion channel family protein [Anaerolineae bacterium]